MTDILNELMANEIAANRKRFAKEREELDRKTPKHKYAVNEKVIASDSIPTDIRMFNIPPGANGAVRKLCGLVGWMAYEVEFIMYSVPITVYCSENQLRKI